MDFSTFQSTLNDPQPPKKCTPVVQALWYDANDNWEKAHEIAQSKEGTRDYDRLHAYLHRKEGDQWNAGYWYRRARAEMPAYSPEQEWEELVKGWL